MNLKIQLILVLFLCFTSISIGQNTDAIASCCTTERGCTGSAYCTACKNCTGCKHCAKNGGSCGVCSPRVSRTYRSSSQASIVAAFSVGDQLKVTSQILNLRKGPSKRFDVIKKLSKNDLLELLEVSGSWLKVRLPEEGIAGYVYKKYVIKTN